MCWCRSPWNSHVGAPVALAHFLEGKYRPQPSRHRYGHQLAHRRPVVVAVAHRKLGPSSRATTSTVDRALPSSAVQLRCWSRPTTTTRLPLARELGGMLGLVPPHDHGEERRLLLPPPADGHPEHRPGDP